MGVFDTVRFDEDVAEQYKLPTTEWQTKTLQFRPSMSTYYVTYEGGNPRVYYKKPIRREKTDEERLSDANKYGFATYEELVDFYETATPKERVKVGLLVLHDTTVDHYEYVDEQYHGSFEIHKTVGGVHYSYDVWCRNGDIEDIVLISTKNVK